MVRMYNIQEHPVQSLQSTLFNAYVALCSIFSQHPVQYLRSTLFNIFEALCSIFSENSVQYFRSTLFNIFGAPCSIFSDQSLQCLRNTLYNVLFNQPPVQRLGNTLYNIYGTPCRLCWACLMNNYESIERSFALAQVFNKQAKREEYWHSIHNISPLWIVICTNICIWPQITK